MSAFVVTGTDKPASSHRSANVMPRRTRSARMFAPTVNVITCASDYRTELILNSHRVKVK